jgi:murein DD-endopeptidase MepM/ murein hydrolase activator NlpD
MEEVVQNKYIFPIKRDQNLEKISTNLSKNFNQDLIEEISGYKVWKYSPMHKDKFEHAIDIFVPVETEIIAVQDGTVIEIIDGNDLYGQNDEYVDKMNYFSILHENNEVSQYVHILKYSLLEMNIKVGDKVKKGQVLGKTGRNGYMSHDHLHFVIFKIENSDYKSLKLNFIT